MNAAWSFDRHTAVRPAGEGRFDAVLSDRFSVGPVPNGGYQMAVLARSISRVVPHPHPLVLSTFFVDRCAAGPAQIRVDPLRIGKASSSVTASLLQSFRRAPS